MRAQPLPDRPQRVLVRGVNWLGDAVMTTPALARLREHFPSAQICLLTPAKLADLWLHHPDIDEVRTFHAGESVLAVARRLRGPGVAAGFRAGLQVFSAEVANVEEELRSSVTQTPPIRPRADTAAQAIARLRQRSFDLALVLPNSPRSALESWLARIPCRVGYARPWRNWFLTQALPSRPGRVAMRKRTPAEIRQLIAAPGACSRPGVDASHAHQVHEYLHLVAALGADPTPVAPFLCVRAEEVTTAQAKFELRPDGIWLGLNPGAEYGPAKRWPAAHFIAAAKQISAARGANWLILGGKGDTALAAEIAGALGPSARNVAGQTSLRELMALLRHCRVLLTNDTGPMHLAAAVGTPVVVPFGSTSPELTGPGLPGDPRHHLLRASAPCAPCFLRECPIDFRCLRGLAPEPVVAAVLKCLPA
jgi:heptosyltransferase-2